MADIRNELRAICESIASDMSYVDAYADEFTNDILEAEVNRHHTGWGTLTIQNVSLLICFGGPNIWADIEESGELVVRGYWGGDAVTVRGTASESLTEWCGEYARAVTA